MYTFIIAFSCMMLADPKPKASPAPKTVAAVPVVTDSAADEVKLRSGKAILGEVLEKTKSGELVMIVNRNWAAKNVPDLAKRWKDLEGATNKKAITAYRSRLEAWKRDRVTLNVRDDHLSVWINAELAQLDKRGNTPTPLLIVRLKPTDIKTTTRRTKEATRMLRLAWKCNFEEAEAMKLAALKDSIAFRGFDPLKDEPVKLDDLLPIYVDSDENWLIRRAATEVAYDSGSCFREFGNALMVDPFAGGNGAMQSFSFSSGGNMNMPRLSIEDQLRTLVPRGRVGAAVTRQSTSDRMDTAAAEVTLWVKSSDGRWRAADSATAVVKAASLKPEDLQKGLGNAAGGGGRMAFSFSQSFSDGFAGPVNSQVVQSHPNLGAASAKASADAREAFLKKLIALKLPIE